MRTITRRIVPLSGIIAVTVLLTAWVTVSAAPPRTSVLPPMHFRSVQTWAHQSLNGATQKAPAGAAYQVGGKLMSGATQIGTFYLSATVISNSGVTMQNIEARFPHRGRVELQGVQSGGSGTSVISGGTGVSAHASGMAVGSGKNGNNITVTFH